MVIREIGIEQVPFAADALSRQPMFANTSREDIEWLAQTSLFLDAEDERLELPEFHAGTLPFIRKLSREHQCNKFLLPFLLTEGIFEYYENNQCNEKQLCLFELAAPYITIDEVTHETGYASNYNVVMKPGTRGFIFDPRKLQDLARKDNRIWHLMVRDKTRLSDSFSLAMRVFLSPTAKLKIAKYLHLYALRRVQKGYEPVLENITQEMLASSLGVSRTTVAEALFDLRQYGAVLPSYGKIVVVPDKCLEAINEYSRVMSGQ